jgi:hypothetical protein
MVPQVDQCSRTRGRKINLGILPSAQDGDAPIFQVADVGLVAGEFPLSFAASQFRSPGKLR